MRALCLVAGLAFIWIESAALAAVPEDPFVTGLFSWRASPALIDVGSGTNAPDPHVSIKDPSVIYDGSRWHVFATVRMKSGKVDTEYLSFTDWAKANEAPRHVLALHDQYYCAPQVFYFEPHKKWYLIYQLAEKTRKPPFGPCFSTTTDLGDPKSWSKPEPMVTNAPAAPKWIDFWVICDSSKAHLFYTSNDGHMWRRETAKTNFPFGWSEPQLALRADIFEASHTYKLKDRQQYVTVIEAQGDRRRYYKAYLADRLEGPWRPLADTIQKPFAGMANVRQEKPWTTNISHGELIRAGTNELMQLDPTRLRFVFQGGTDDEYRGNRYGAIPWRLGMLQQE